MKGLKRIPCPSGDPGCIVDHFRRHSIDHSRKADKEVSNLNAIRQRRMQLAGAVEDIVEANLFAFVNQLKDEGLLTEKDAHESLAKFHESLQTPGT